MRRRSRASSKPTKARRHRAKTPKGGATEVARLRRELDDAREQQTATAEVVKIISTSPSELGPVLEVVVESAARFCDAVDVSIFELDGQHLRITAAHWGAVPQDVGARFACVRGHVSGRAVLDRKPVHVTDLHAEAEEFPEGSAFARRLGFRTTAAVPLLREGVAVGAIVLRRDEVKAFTNKQITLLETFAAQAVIAIENARLLNELRQSLERQTATSEVLGVISRSPGELETVFHAILENATLICEANFGILQLLEGEAARIAAMHNVPAAFVQHRQREPLLHASPASAIGRAIATRRLVHIPDYAADAAYSTRDPAAVKLVELAGARSLINVPMLKDDELIGIISIYRQEVRPFTDKKIALVQNFAAQAVIAIENARLLSELRQRTAELSESLEQQTATSEILKVISSSPGELQSVFQTILTNATRICDAKFGAVYLYDGNLFHCSGEVGSSPDYAEFQRKRGAFRPQPGTHMDRIIRTKQVNVTADATAEAVVGPVATIGGARSVVSVPMLKDDELIGVVGVYRQEVRPFNDKQIELVKNFAAQAVIAIENARLLNELRQRTSDLTEALEQQTATSDVLRVISSSPGELEPVFQAILANA